jgi:hypothetical protein
MPSKASNEQYKAYMFPLELILSVKASKKVVMPDWPGASRKKQLPSSMRVSASGKRGKTGKA